MGPNHVSARFIGSSGGQHSGRGPCGVMTTIAMHRGMVDDALTRAPGAQRPELSGFTDADVELGDQPWNGAGLNPLDDAAAASPFEMLPSFPADVSGACMP